MVNSNRVKGLIVENGYSMSEVAELLGISTASLNRRLKKGVFKSNEIDILIKELKITDPMPIFFA